MCGIDNQSLLPSRSWITFIFVPSVLPGLLGVLHPGALERQMVLRTGEGRVFLFPFTPFFPEGVTLPLHMVEDFTCRFKFLF